jgi:hypothetical protein
MTGAIGTAALVLQATALAGLGPANNLTALLFLDGSHLQSWSGLQLRIGSTSLLSEYKDPTSFVGWGYPSVWRKAAGGWRLMYQGWHLSGGKEDTKLGLLADSVDAVHWSPARPATPSYNVSNCVLVNGANEFSVVYDDARYTASAADRLKCLWGGDKITASGDDGESWHEFGQWTSQPIDPGVSVYRNPLDPAQIVVTARPQALRRTDGRHAGFHAGLGWASLGTQLNQRALPLDEVFTKTNEPYGLPSFAYHGNVISWFWRYACPKYPCFKDGTVSSALAFSANSVNWTAFGQFPFPPASDARDSTVTHYAPEEAVNSVPGPVVGRGPLNNTDIASKAYGHTYTVYANKTAGAYACQAECDADHQCVAFTCKFVLRGPGSVVQPARPTVAARC